MCDWAPWLWLVMAIGVAIMAAFLRLERAVARDGGMPLIDLTLLADAAFMRGLGAVFFFFFANLSFYLVMTHVHAARRCRFRRLPAGLVFVPLALAFVVASRHSGARAKHRGTHGADRGLRAADRGPRGAGADGRIWSTAPSADRCWRSC